MPVVISGFSPTDKVPGAYGEVVYGAGGQSAASIPLLCLLVGLLASPGNLTPDTEVRAVYSLADIDAAAGAGSELACMAYDALAAAPGTPLFLMSPTAAAGATAATAFITVTGPATGNGTIGVRIGGYYVGTQIANGDASTAIAVAIAANINGANTGRLPVSATSSGSVVTLSCKTNGVRGMQHVVALDTSVIAGGVTATWYSTWTAASTLYSSAVPSVVVPPAAATTGAGYYFKDTVGGSGGTGTTGPTWAAAIGGTNTDVAATWTNWGTVDTSSALVSIVNLGYCTGTETYTAALLTLANVQYDRIALAANDSVSLAAWKVQIDAQATVAKGLLQHVMYATDGTLAAAEALAGTTLNDQRFCALWQLNSETHPSRIAAAFAAVSTLTEQSDPAASYDSLVLTTVVPQAQKADWPTHATLVAALNNGVTPLFTYGDGQSRICRAITTHCLNSSNPDYSTLDLYQARCPDYVLKDLKLVFTTSFQPNNPRAQNDPAIGDRRPPSGVAYPELWSSVVNKELNDMGNAVNPGTCPPILVYVGSASGPSVTSSWDPQAKRIVSAVPINVAPADHQLGISVRQVS